MRVGESLKYLKREWNRKEGRGNKDFKKGGKLGEEMGASEKGRTGSPLQTEYSIVLYGAQDW